MSCIEKITFVKELILVGVAIFGAYVAHQGLGTWQRQLKGQSEYELSRRILINLFKYRDAINNARSSVMWANEMPSPPEEKAKEMDRDQIIFYGQEKAYEGRWKRILDQKSILCADLLEAEAIYGDELKKLFDKIFKLEYELLIQTRFHLKLLNPDTKEHIRESTTQALKNTREIIYCDLPYEIDEYQKDLLAAISEVEAYTKPKLRK